MFNSKKFAMVMVLLLMVTVGSAIAGDTNYEVYGQLRTSINMLNNGNDSQVDLTSNASRFGFKGSNVLNDNFSVIWQFENEVEIANGGGTELATRNSFVGFQHATAGQIFMGHHDTPFKTLGRMIDLFPAEMGDFRTLTSRGPVASMLDFSEDGIGYNATKTQWDSRLDDVIAWRSPSFNGVKFFLAYQLDQNDKLDGADTSSYDGDSVMSGMVSYDKNGIFVGAAMEQLGNNMRANYTTGSDIHGPVYAYGDNPMAMRFAAKYTTEQFIISGLYQYIWSQADAFVASDHAFMDVNSATMGLSAQYMVNDQISLKGMYFMTDEWTDLDDDLSPSMFAFGVDYQYTENFKLYGQFAMVSNDGVSNVELGGGQNEFGGSVGGARAADTDDNLYEDPYGISVGSVVTW